MNIKATILIAALALLALPAIADERFPEPHVMIMPVEESYSLGTYMDNPCTAYEDYVLVDYNVHLYHEEMQSGSSQRFYLDDTTNMGSSQYAAYGSVANDVAYSIPFTVRNYYKVNTYDNFHVVTVIDFDPSTRSTSVSVETACGDGTPGSAQ